MCRAHACYKAMRIIIGWHVTHSSVASAKSKAHLQRPNASEHSAAYRYIDIRRREYRAIELQIVYYIRYLCAHVHEKVRVLIYGL